MFAIFNVCSAGRGAVYSFDPVGSYQRDTYKAGGSASAMLQPLLDNQVNDTHWLYDLFMSSVTQTYQGSNQATVQTSTHVCLSLHRLVSRTWRVCSRFHWLRRRQFSWSKMCSSQLQRETSTPEMPFISASSQRKASKTKPFHWGRTERHMCSPFYALQIHHLFGYLTLSFRAEECWSRCCI